MLSLRLWSTQHGNLGHHTEGALRPNKEMFQMIAGIILFEVGH